MKRGAFISLEGIEGVGKSTALLHIQSMLELAGIEYVCTREPGGTPLAESIRQLLLGQHGEVLSANTELLLMFAARAQNIQEVIVPALESGKWVVADRFTDASFAYQGGGRGIALDHIASLAQLIQGDLQPDLTLLLDARVEVGLARINGRGEKDRIESEKNEFFDRVRQQYLRLAKQHPARFRVVNAEQTLNEVKQQLSDEINRLVLQEGRV